MTAELISEIFQVCIIPLLGVLTAYAVKIIKVKTEEIKTSTNNSLQQKYVDLLSTTITKCVIATNQTYVDEVKKNGALSKNTQKKAFDMTLQAVQNILTDEAKQYLSEVYGDLDKYIETQIEAAVNENKTSDSESAE